MELPRAIPCNNSVSSFESLPIANVFSERANTHRSSGSSSRFDDKPLPAIKPEPRSPSDTQIAQSTTSKPSKLPQSQVPTPRPQQLEPKKKSSPLKKESSPPSDNIRPSRPNLTIRTASAPTPQPPTKDRPVRSSSIPVTGQPIPKPITDQPNITMSPAPMSSGPMSAISPHQSQKPTRMAHSSNVEKATKPAKGQTPVIEVSTARSVSVSKGRRQMLVPIGSRVDQFESNERFVDRKALTPRITEVSIGHRPAKSQQLQIESL